MSTGIYYTVTIIAMRQIVAFLSGIESKFQHLHSGIAAIFQKFYNSRSLEAKIFRNDLLLAQSCVQSVEQLDSGSFLPMSVNSSLIAVRNAIIFVKSSEVINSYHIIHLEAMIKSSAPPLITGLSMVIPTIQRISPQLSVSRECIRRTAGYSTRLEIRIELEQFRRCPCVCRVKGYINRNITNDFNTIIISIFLQFIPLFLKGKLKIFIKFNIKVAFSAIVIHRKAPTLLNIFCPLTPASTVKSLFHCHEQCIVIQPSFIFLNKSNIVRIL